MNRVRIFGTLYLSVLAAICAPAAAQDATLELIDSTLGRSVYQLSAEWGDAEVDVGGLLESSVVLDLPALVQPSVRVLEAEYDEYSFEPVKGVGEEAAVVVGLGLSRKRPAATLVARLVTYDSTSAKLRRYRHMRIEVIHPVYQQVPTSYETSDNPHLDVSRSVLADGQFFKLAVSETGVYRIDRTFLESLPGLDTPVGSIDPDQVRIFGNGGAPVPALNSAPRIADLAENQVFVQGGGDGSFDAADAVWFYAQGPSGWQSRQLTGFRGRPILDPSGEPVREWSHYVHPFDSTNYYFLSIGSSTSETYLQEDYPDAADTVLLSEITGRYFVDLDEYLWGREGGHSGHTWVSALIPGPGPGRTVFENFQLPGLTGGTLHYQIRAAIQSNPAATLHYRGDNSTLHSVNYGASSGLSTSIIARSGIADFTQTVTAGQQISLTVDLDDQAGGPLAALDWVRIFYPKTLQADQQPVRFHTPLAEAGTFTFVLRGFSSPPFVLDITQPGDYRWLGLSSRGGEYWAQVTAASADEPRELIAFTSNQVRTLDATEACGPECRVTPQNLHGIQAWPDFVIITPNQFIQQSNALADRRRAEGLTVEVVDVQQIYNEFSGGLQDVRGIRDYLKFLYDRSPDEERLLRYVLLFGDGHFDYRNLDASATFPNHIPPFETEDSWDPERSYTSDDYYGLLDDNEGLWPYIQKTFQDPYAHLNERVDLGIGRFTVHTEEEAQLMIDKIVHYESPNTYGQWRNRYLFLADDGPTGISGTQNDKDLHTQNTDVVAVAVAKLAPDVNQRKVYALSYTREFLNTWRVPKARQDLLLAIDEGVLVVNYSGHGGERSLAQENLFTVEDSRSLQNYDRLPIFITATCSFGRWDLGNEQTGAEELLLNRNGGAIALLTTVRQVYTSGTATTLNVGLNVALNEELFKREADQLLPRIGDALRRTKNRRVGYEGNNRKFNLLGDPTLRPGLPASRAVVTHINDNQISTATGQMRALERIELKGEIQRSDGSLDTSFDGAASLTVFDALRHVPIPPEMFRHMPQRYYEVREDLIWRGRTRVTDGRIVARFVVPKDISYANRPGRVTLYAQSAAEHVNVHSERF
ncbi:MAG: type IX secretion system sortase PorU, partial [Rhodothermaceae bacterium]|nr:type IX secretion system sortase PorU [Rhodothermaceae bacterium]